MSRVDRCICRNVTFAEVLRLHAQGLTLEEIRARTGCSTECGLCGPYIDAAVATGRATLPVMTPAELRALAGRDPS